MRPAAASARAILGRLRPVFITTTASAARMWRASSASGRVPISTVIASSPQVIGWPMAFQQPVMPGMPGMISTVTMPCSRACRCMNEP